MPPCPAHNPSSQLFNVPACFSSFQKHRLQPRHGKTANAQSHLFKDFAKVESLVIEWKRRRTVLWSPRGANGLDCLSPCWKRLSWGQCESQGVLSKVDVFRGPSQQHISKLSKCWFVHTNIRGALNELTKDTPRGCRANSTSVKFTSFSSITMLTVNFHNMFSVLKYLCSPSRRPRCCWPVLVLNWCHGL